MSKNIKRKRNLKYKGWYKTELIIMKKDFICYPCEKNKKLYIIGSNRESDLGCYYMGCIPIKNYPNLLKKIGKSESLPEVKFIISKKQLMEKINT